MSSLDKCRAARDQLASLLPGLLGDASNPMVSIAAGLLQPMAEEWLDDQLARRSAGEVDELLDGVIAFIAALRSDGASTLVVNPAGPHDVIRLIPGPTDGSDPIGWEPLNPVGIGGGDPVPTPAVHGGPDRDGQVDVGQGAAHVGGAAEPGG